MRLLLAGSSALALGAVVVLTGSAHAASKAPVTVTIKAEGTDMSGSVKSAQRVCAADRTVVVFKQKGSRGGGDDVRFASDTTDLQGTKYVWSTGNTGTEGRFYAKLKATVDCKAAASRTIRVQRDD
jgi:hypothetical protein